MAKPRQCSVCAADVSAHQIGACAEEARVLNKKPTEYWYISQAETTIKGVNDKEEFAMTDVSAMLGRNC